MSNYGRIPHHRGSDPLLTRLMPDRAKRPVEALIVGGFTRARKTILMFRLGLKIHGVEEICMEIDRKAPGTLVSCPEDAILSHANTARHWGA